MVNTLKSASRFGVLTTLAEDGKSPKSRASSRIDIERKSSCGHRNGSMDQEYEGLRRRLYGREMPWNPR